MGFLRSRHLSLFGAQEINQLNNVVSDQMTYEEARKACKHLPVIEFIDAQQREIERLSSTINSCSGRIQRLTAACMAHRACCGTEHDPANGKLHGCCIVCGVSWPCDTAKSFLVTPTSISVRHVGNVPLRLIERLQKLRDTESTSIRDGQALTDTIELLMQRREATTQPNITALRTAVSHLMSHWDEHRQCFVECGTVVRELREAFDAL